jgi:hypothetical protein
LAFGFRSAAVAGGAMNMALLSTTVTGTAATGMFGRLAIGITAAAAAMWRFVAAHPYLAAIAALLTTLGGSWLFGNEEETAPIVPMHIPSNQVNHAQINTASHPQANSPSLNSFQGGALAGSYGGVSGPPRPGEPHPWMQYVQPPQEYDTTFPPGQSWRHYTQGYTGTGLAGRWTSQQAAVNPAANVGAAAAQGVNAAANSFNAPPPAESAGSPFGAPMRPLMDWNMNARQIGTASEMHDMIQNESIRSEAEQERFQIHMASLEKMIKELDSINKHTQQTANNTAPPTGLVGAGAQFGAAP